MIISKEAPNWYILGAQCNTNTCNNGGACSIQNGIATCTCYPDFSGEFCNTCTNSNYQPPNCGSIGNIP